MTITTGFRLFRNAVLFGLLLMGSPSAAHAAMHGVMIINSYHAEHPWVMRENLQGIAEISCHYLDAKRVSREQCREMADYVLVVVEKEQPAVVVLTDDSAVQVLGMRIMELGIPVVFLGVNANPRNYLGEMGLATGVLERPLFKRSLAFLQEIIGPELRKCVILFDDSMTSRAIHRTIFNDRSRLMLAGVEAEFKTVATFEEWKQRVLSAKDKGDGILFAGLYHTLKDADGNHVPGEVVIRWTSENSPVPVFGYWVFSVGKGKAVGGLVNSGKAQGRDAAELVRRVLSGEAPETLYPVTSEHGDFLFSLHELKRWGMEIPPGLTKRGGPIFLVE